MYIEHFPHAWHQASCLEYLDEWDTQLPLKNLWFGNQVGKGTLLSTSIFGGVCHAIVPFSRTTGYISTDQESSVDLNTMILFPQPPPQLHQVT